MIDRDSVLEAVHPAVARHRIPGVAAAASDRSGGVWTEAIGGVAPSTVFEGASLSKPVFATGVLRLAERDDLDLDRSLTTYLGERHIPDPRVDLITARMVLCHTSGFPNGRDRMDETPGLLRDPGVEFGYSGEGYFYLQRAVKRLTGGRSLADWMRGEFLDAADLDDTSFVWLDSYEQRSTVGHDPDGRALEKAKPDRGISSMTLHTTAPDFARFMALLHGGELLDASTLADMLRPHVEVHEDWGCGAPDATWWGLGWGLTQTPLGMSAWQWGWNPGFRNFAITWLEHGDSLVVLTNSDNGLWAAKDAVTAAQGSEHHAFRWLEH